MHQTKPIQPVILNDNLSPCEVINQNFINHEKFIKEQIEKQHVSMQPCGDFPYKKMGALS